nr:N-acetylmuramoyl-L-alanine amidase [Streptomyces dengpaensis]
MRPPWTARRTFEYWRDSTNLESHFGLGYAGDLAQFIGTQTRADANAAANRRADGTGAVSIETASNLGATDKWTGEQVEQLIKLGVWLHKEHGIPLRCAAPPTTPDSAGTSSSARGTPTSTPAPARPVSSSSRPSCSRASSPAQLAQPPRRTTCPRSMRSLRRC